MTRLSLQVVYLWRHVSSNLEILFGPLHRSSPFIGEPRCQAIQMEHSPYIAERTQKKSILWDVCGLNQDKSDFSEENMVSNSSKDF
jgi:hypothetical protein